MQKVAGLDHGSMLWLDREGGFGDDRLQRADVLLVAREERLVSEQDDATLKMLIEMPDQVSGGGYMAAVLPKQPQ
jgi:hypothetical protein